MDIWFLADCNEFSNTYIFSMKVWLSEESMNNSLDFLASYLLMLAAYNLICDDTIAFKSASSKINFYFLWYSEKVPSKSGSIFYVINLSMKFIM